jgi:hypothetical protein
VAGDTEREREVAGQVADHQPGDGSTAGTITTGYDAWGRQVTYQPSGDAPTTTVYNGAVATVTEPNGTRTYTFDGSDANGKTEHRGLPTKIDVTTSPCGVTSASSRQRPLGRGGPDPQLAREKSPTPLQPVDLLDTDQPASRAAFHSLR